MDAFDKDMTGTTYLQEGVDFIQGKVTKKAQDFATKATKRVGVQDTTTSTQEAVQSGDVNTGSNQQYGIFLDAAGGQDYKTNPAPSLAPAPYTQEHTNRVMSANGLIQGVSSGPPADTPEETLSIARAMMNMYVGSDVVAVFNEAAQDRLLNYFVMQQTTPQTQTQTQPQQTSQQEVFDYSAQQAYYAQVQKDYDAAHPRAQQPAQSMSTTNKPPVVYKGGSMTYNPNPSQYNTSTLFSTTGDTEEKLNNAKTMLESVRSKLGGKQPTPVQRTLINAYEKQINSLEETLEKEAESYINSVVDWRTIASGTAVNVTHGDTKMRCKFFSPGQCETVDDDDTTTPPGPQIDIPTDGTPTTQEAAEDASTLQQASAQVQGGGGGGGDEEEKEDYDTAEEEKEDFDTAEEDIDDADTDTDDMMSVMSDTESEQGSEMYDSDDDVVQPLEPAEDTTTRRPRHTPKHAYGSILGFVMYPRNEEGLYVHNMVAWKSAV
jgi:hypothetical protein